MFDFQPKIARIRYDKVPHLNPLPRGEEGALAPGEGKRPPLQIRQVSVAIPQRSIAERNLDIAGGLNHLAIRRYQPQAINRIGDGYVADLIVLIADH
jgi:hypothetical protein